VAVTASISSQLAAQQSASLDTAFQARIYQAVAAAAVAISSELSTTPLHTQRCTLSKSVLNTPDQYVRAFSIAVASQGVSNADTDATIDTTVSAVWNAIAGVL